MVDIGKVQLKTYSETETRKLGEVIGRNLTSGDVVALIGDLGAGKTCLTKGIAKTLGVSNQYEITSPTFTIINEYPARHTLWHVDAYRLDSSQDILDAGFEDFFGSGGVVVIEWAEKIINILPEDALIVNITYVDDSTRTVELLGKTEMIKKIEQGYMHQ
ncbi:MAG: tRNA (adenosine(37)-N6)-threonylcarbamoyltransferase complex ATPase subunit type 1 TsaE [Syntrophaceae bacterium]|nr:tRNA (adenosine(37)-N6)-threonylcarbamoyltransferase complex ATPase subunit type 1 TsaE [Syntrophaceae bacterium]